VVRYTPHRAFVLTMNSASGSLSHLATKPRKRRTRSSDAVVGGGAGPSAGKTP
jgi:2,3-bisphosphoglycerate-dependent phosphoglycerate mutase